ncbi:hypothetical protein [Brevibacillus brevis]|uniref:hypothetical protein n=1 Tax=Brevibacillus brevis TaxID=1393 RepID=UPI0037C9ED34
MINLELILPCLEGNEDHIFYKGDTSLLKNMCKKCEYFSPLRFFMNKHYKDFRLERCCEVEIKNRGKQPEAIFVNKSNPNEKIVIEVKSQLQMFATDIKRDEKETSRRKRFEKKIINDIAKNTFIKANELLEKFNIVLPTDLESIFLRGYVLSISRIPENVELMGKRFGVRRSVVEEILSYKGEREKRLIDAIAGKNVQFLVNNIIDCGLNGADKFSIYHEYTIDKLSFMLQKADIDSDFSVRYIEYPSGVRDYFIPTKEAIEARMYKRFEECKLKFSNYMSSEYKRILLIENENHYLKSNMLEILQNIEVPGYIDELWSSFYIIEEVWNEKIEDFEDTIVGVEYIKIYPA